MANIVHCRLCKVAINRDKQTDWVLPSRNYYFHAACWDNWKNQKTERDLNIKRENDDWYILLKDYIWKDIHMTDARFSKIDSQWNHFLVNKKQPMTAKGIYFAVLYFYEVMHGSSEKADGGIGIVPFIYNESCAYWQAREEQQSGFLDKVAQQMAERAAMPELKFDPRTKTRRKPKWNMEEL